MCWFCGEQHRREGLLLVSSAAGKGCWLRATQVGSSAKERFWVGAVQVQSGTAAGDSIGAKRNFSWGAVQVQSGA
jgi:hypothetical protein